jgi:hypothetical protein
MSSIHNISSLLPIINNVLQTAGVKSTANAASATPSSDSGQLSPLAQLMSTLQQLKQSDPAKYQQVTGQIATNLQSAAQAAQTAGNTSAANQLNQLATDFSTASTSGQLPNIQDLAKAVGGHHHHHSKPSGDSDGDSTTATTTTDPFSPTPSTTGSQSDPFNAAAIILNTLSSAGVTSNS